MSVLGEEHGTDGEFIEGVNYAKGTAKNGR